MGNGFSASASDLRRAHFVVSFFFVKRDDFARKIFTRA